MRGEEKRGEENKGVEWIKKRQLDNCVINWKPFLKMTVLFTVPDRLLYLTMYSTGSITHLENESPSSHSPNMTILHFSDG